jgi:hypothetical protein
MSGIRGNEFNGVYDLGSDIKTITEKLLLLLPLLPLLLLLLLLNDKSYPWERDELGIWLVDGSPSVMQRFENDPIPDTMKYYDIMELIGLPKWPGADSRTTLFELAARIQETFGVSYVNFIDFSCRWDCMPELDDNVASTELREFTPRGNRKIVKFNDMEIEIMYIYIYIYIYTYWILAPYVIVSSLVQQVSRDTPGGHACQLASGAHSRVVWHDMA